MIIVPPPTTTHTTARSRALTERLRSTIADFQAREPKLTNEEIAQALHALSRPLDRRPRGARVAALATAAGTVAALGIGLLVSSAQKPGRAASSWVAVSLIAVMLVAGVMIALRSRDDD